jgi:hypothetical protein
MPNTKDYLKTIVEETTEGINGRLFACRSALLLMLPAYLISISYVIASVYEIAGESDGPEGYSFITGAILFSLSGLSLYWVLNIVVDGLGSIFCGEDILKGITESPDHYEPVLSLVVIIITLPALFVWLMPGSSVFSVGIVLLILTTIAGDLIRRHVRRYARGLFVSRDEFLYKAAVDMLGDVGTGQISVEQWASIQNKRVSLKW